MLPGGAVSGPDGTGAREREAIDLGTQGRHDGGGDIALHGEHVVEIPVVRRRPSMRAVGCVDELGGDTHLVARLAHAAFEHVPDPQLLRDRRDVVLAATKRERRRARNDAQLRHFGEEIQHFLGEAVREPCVVARGAHVEERQHRDRTDTIGRSCHGRRVAPLPQGEPADACKGERERSARKPPPTLPPARRRGQRLGYRKCGPRVRRTALHIGDEPVAMPRHGHDEPMVVGMFAQHLPEHMDRLCQVAFLDDHLGPDGGEQGPLLHSLRSVLHEVEEDAERFWRQLDRPPIA